MGHHSDEPFDGDPEAFRKAFEQKAAGHERQEILRKMLDTTAFRGAIGSFPEGKLTPKDEGAIQFAVGEQDGKVVIDFGTAVRWVGMTPQQAADLASSIMEKARLAGRKAGETIALTL